MFNWDNGEIWVHSVPHRPALDVVSGALFLIGVVLVLIRYIRQRHWQDLFLLSARPPAATSLHPFAGFSGGKSRLNRAAGALVPTFLLVAIALDGLVAAGKTGLPAASTHLNWQALSPEQRLLKKRWLGPSLPGCLCLLLAGWSSCQNYDLVFNQYATQYTAGAWNSSEMGAVIKQFRGDLWLHR